jgi:hypothetical protein
MRGFAHPKFEKEQQFCNEGCAQMKKPEQNFLFHWKKQIATWILEFLKDRGLKPRPFVMKYLESHGLITPSVPVPRWEEWRASRKASSQGLASHSVSVAEQRQRTQLRSPEHSDSASQIVQIPEQAPGKYFCFILSGPDPVLAVKQLLAQGFPDVGLPSGLWIDQVPQTVSPQWMDLLHPSGQSHVVMEWRNGSRITVSSFELYDGGGVESSRKDGPIAVAAVENLHVLYQTYKVVVSSRQDFASMDFLALLKDVPFLLGSMKTRYPEWLLGSLESGTYIAPAFDEGHYRHGWACLFKGEGHRRLVSRRFLDYGPWRVLRGENDITLVQFHDLEADAKTALEQARSGHACMGVTSQGTCGFIQTDFPYRYRLHGRYFPEQRTLEFVINGQEVSQGDMLEACAARSEEPFESGQPIEHIRYVFIEEAEARAHLHELWLRDIECWTFIAGNLVRIDTDYHPIPNPPEWVRQAEIREKNENGKKEDFLSFPFQIHDLQITEDQYQFLMLADDHGVRVGCRVTVAKTMQAGFDEQSNFIFGHVYKNGISFSRSGPESDQWVASIAKQCSFEPVPNAMVERETFSAILLQNGEIDMAKEPVRFKLFGKDGKGELAGASYESILVLDIPQGLVTWSEKHPAYRKALVSALGGIPLNDVVTRS